MWSCVNRREGPCASGSFPSLDSSRPGTTDAAVSGVQVAAGAGVGVGPRAGVGGGGLSRSNTPGSRSNTPLSRSNTPGVLANRSSPSLESIPSGKMTRLGRAGGGGGSANGAPAGGAAGAAGAFTELGSKKMSHAYKFRKKASSSDMVGLYRGGTRLVDNPRLERFSGFNFFQEFEQKK